jgi:Zn-dependent peptidase ImmA (M78 family)
MTKVSDFLAQLDLSADEIALKAHLPTERIRAILSGADVSLADLRAIARGLKIPIRTFAGDPSTTSDLALLFRSTVPQRSDLGVEQAAAFVNAALSIMPARSRPPDWLAGFAYERETYQEAERLAQSFRLIFMTERQDDPLLDLPQILVQLGGIILGRLETSRFEGASVIADGYAFIFVSPRFVGRMLFTLAHELGHLIAHHRERRAVVFDRATQIGGHRYRDTAEAFVDAFASVLLMPARGVALALKQIRETLNVKNPAIGDIELLYLSRFFGVSFEVAARRCEQLELLPPGGARTFLDHMKQFGGAEKRAEALDLPKRPIVSIPRVSANLLKAAADLCDQGKISIGWITDQLGCSVNDIYVARVPSEASRGLHH